MFTHTNLVQPYELKSVTDLTKGRRYLTPEGISYPSITTVLSGEIKPAVIEWRNSLGAQAADIETKRATDRGTAVHDMVEKFLKNDQQPTKNHIQQHINDFNQLRLHLKKINNIALQEAVLWSDLLKVAGRVDCVAEFQGTLSIIDFKTSTNSKTTSMIEDYYLQTAGYALMFEERYNIIIEDIVIIMSVERGAVPLIFREKVSKYIPALCKRVSDYHKNKWSK